MSILGIDGTALDPDVEVKGFAVFGSTQSAYAGAVVGAGNVVVNGVLSVSSGAYFVGTSTFTAAAKIYINDGSAGQILGKNSGGWLEWLNSSGDNLGNHTATTDLSMNSHNITGTGKYMIGTDTVLAVYDAASESLGVGISAGRVTTGVRNTFVGRTSGYYNVAGDRNTAVGYASLNDNISGQYNVAMGVFALNNNLVNYNTGVGYAVLQTNTTGVGNSAYGDHAMASGSGGSNNTALGRESLDNVSGSNNIGIGYRAGNSITSGTGNIVIGYDQDTTAVGVSNELNIGGVIYGDLSSKKIGVGAAGPAERLSVAGNITATGRYMVNGSTVLAVLAGNRSFGAGLSAGAVNTADDNTFVGYSAGGAMATGIGNTATGASALMSGNSGNYNVSTGYYALRNATTSRNTATGAFALATNTAGYYNTAYGYSTLYYNLIGNDNTAIGYQSLYSNVGSNNTALGDSAQYSNISGSNNTAVGYSAMYNNGGGGSANVALGNSAGYNPAGSATVYFSSATLIGSFAGYNLSTGNDNVFVGWRAGYDVTTGTGNIIVGYNQQPPSAGTNNYLNIGGLVYGNLSSRTVGVNRTSQQAALDIVSTGTAANIYAQIWRNGSGTIVSSMTSQGVLYPSPAGDNLGNHTATLDLNMNGKDVMGAVRYKIGTDTVLALYDSGSYSLGVGINAGRVTTGTQNVFVGRNTGYSNGDGTRNAAVGYGAMNANITGDYNAALGNFALYGNTADYNTGLGHGTLETNSAGAWNTAVGATAMNSGNGGSGNTAIGGDALRSASGSNNVAVGYQAGDSITSGSGNIVIGYNQDTSASGVSNEMNIGGVIYGLLSTGKVGIGTAAPESALHVPDGMYAQFQDNNAGAPPAADCDADAERGRLSIDTTNNRLYICNGAARGWDYLALTD
ncbi:MAG: hypothetical protein PHV33_07445 [Elusimicrobiales bacterium]|nr:hypothetical protein [Elusimicrobiales bacterium]